jgi:polysaccharide export outer membrane protein
MLLPVGLVWGCCTLLAGCAAATNIVRGPEQAPAAPTQKTWAGQQAGANPGVPGNLATASLYQQAAGGARAIPTTPSAPGGVQQVVWESTADGKTVQVPSGGAPAAGPESILQPADSNFAEFRPLPEGGVPLVQPPPLPGKVLMMTPPGQVQQVWMSDRPVRHFHGNMAVAPAVAVLPEDAPNEIQRVLLPPYVIGPPDVLDISLFPKIGLQEQPVRGPHLVRPDGTVSLGIYGSARVAGLTLDEARAEVARVILSKLNQEDFNLEKVLAKLSVDVLAYNSKVYYVITDGAGYGEQVYPFPVTGNETVLDALGKINGVPPVGSKKHIWVARRTPGHGAPDVKLDVDWCAITRRGEAATNYQVMPGDRIYVRADALIATDRWLQKLLAPVERVLGVTLLGSETVNSIRNK